MQRKQNSAANFLSLLLMPYYIFCTVRTLSAYATIFLRASFDILWSKRQLTFYRYYRKFLLSPKKWHLRNETSLPHNWPCKTRQPFCFIRAWNFFLISPFPMLWFLSHHSLICFVNPITKCNRRINRTFSLFFWILINSHKKTRSPQAGLDNRQSKHKQSIKASVHIAP